MQLPLLKVLSVKAMTALRSNVLTRIAKLPGTKNPGGEFCHGLARAKTLYKNHRFIQEARDHQPAAPVERPERLLNHFFRFLHAAGHVADSVIAGFKKIGSRASGAERHHPDAVRADLFSQSHREAGHESFRSEERRVGKECRSRGG